MPTANPIFPLRNGNDALAAIRDFGTTPFFRRGADQASTQAGGSFAQLLMAGQWRSSAHRLYLDLGRKESLATASILVAALDEGGPEW